MHYWATTVLALGPECSVVGAWCIWSESQCREGYDRLYDGKIRVPRMGTPTHRFPGLSDLVRVRSSHAMIFRMRVWGLSRFDDTWAMTRVDETSVAEDRVQNHG